MLRRLGLLRCLLLAFGLLVIGPTASAMAAAPVNQTPPTVTTTPFGGPPASTVATGGTLYCQQGTWNEDPNNGIFYQFQYEFKRDGTVIGSGFGSDNSYATTAADTGHKISCTVQATNFSDNPATNTTKDSSNSVLVTPLANVTITRFSPTVSGNIGEKVGGVQVTVTVTRTLLNQGGSVDVATFTTNTDSNGKWSGTLTNENPSGGVQRAPVVDEDVVTVKYAQGTAPQGTALPGTQTFGNAQRRFGVGGAALSDLDLATIAADGKSAQFPADSVVNGNGNNPCANVTFVHDGTAFPTTQTPGPNGNQECRADFSKAPVTNETLVLVDVTDQLADGSNVTLSGPVGLLGVGAGSGFAGINGGPPRCTGDLVRGTVQCAPLPQGVTFTITRVRSGAQDTPLDLTPDPADSSAGDGTFSGGLQAGDILQLRVKGGQRVLTSLLLTPLSLNLQNNTVTPGSKCTPGRWFGGPTASFGGVQGICPQDGNTPAGEFEFNVNSQIDDGSGGATQVTVPQFTQFVPNDGDSVTSPFNAFADTDFAPKSVTLTIINRATDQPVAPTQRPVPAGGLPVTDLTAGRYNAQWNLTDAQGDGTQDSRTNTTQFVVQPGGGSGGTGQPGSAGAQGPAGPQGPGGAQGAQGPGGPQGAQGPQGPAGRNATVTCKVSASKIVAAKAKKKGKKSPSSSPKVTCTVVFANSKIVGKVRAALARGGHVYARGTSRHGGLRLGASQALKPGVYSLRLVTGSGHHRKTTTVSVTVR